MDIQEQEKAFDLACRAGDLATMDALLAARHELASRPRPLIEAARRGDAAVVGLLLARGADPAAPEAGRSLHRPLFECVGVVGPCHAGHLAVLERLVAAGCPLTEPGRFQSLPPLALAAAKGHASMVSALRRHGAPVDVFAAAMTLDLDSLRRCLESDPGAASAVDVKGRTALHCLGMSRLWQNGEATASKATSVVDLLLAAGAELDAPTLKEGPPTAFRPTPLWWAVASGRHEALIVHLLKLGAAPDDCFPQAAYHGLCEALEALLAAGVPVDALNRRGETALQHCLLHSRPKAVPWLLAHGADVTRRSPQGLSALELARLTKQSATLIASLERAEAASVSD